jgi:predicted 3-demethylubiquinone-9 3-methyltransferase (glyoxalase superfamily)
MRNDMIDISTHLMFQSGAARAAVEEYVSIIPGSSIDDIDGDDGPGQTIRFTLAGRPHIAFDSPPQHDFDFTPSMSIFVTCTNESEVDRIFGRLSDGGNVMMPLDNYGFSPRFGWCTDRHGVSWQVSCARHEG